MNKQVLTELIQHRLGSGEAPQDVRRRYPYQEIERILGILYSDQGYLNFMTLQDMAMSYSTTATKVGTKWQVTLPVKPVGSFGIISVTDGCIWYPVYQGGQEKFVLSIANPNMKNSCVLTGGDTLVFNCKPEENIDVLMVPDYYSLDPSDEIILPGGLNTVFEGCIRIMMATDNRVQERFNDNRDDQIPKRNEWQTGKN